MVTHLSPQMNWNLFQEIKWRQNSNLNVYLTCFNFYLTWPQGQWPLTSCNMFLIKTCYFFLYISFYFIKIGQQVQKLHRFSFWKKTEKFIKHENFKKWSFKNWWEFQKTKKHGSPKIEWNYLKKQKWRQNRNLNVTSGEVNIWPKVTPR